MRWTTRLMAVFSAVMVSVALLSGVALASNDDVHDEWWNGLGDGTDNDNYLHPFNDNRNNHDHCNRIRLTFWHSNFNIERVAGNENCQSHNHFNWRPYERLDCKFAAVPSAFPGGANEHAKMYEHYHIHHNWCL